MNDPKVDNNIRKAYVEMKDQHTANATAPEELLSKESGKSKEFVAQHTDNIKHDETEEKGHKDVSKAGRVTSQSPTRKGDQRNGDKNVVNPVAGAKKFKEFRAQK
jgi:hypothetical protein